MTAPYRDPEMPRHAKRVRWRKVALWAFATMAFLAALITIREVCLYLKAHPSPTLPTEKDERKGAEGEAARSLRALFPGKSYSVHCAYYGTRSGSGCTDEKVFSCLSFIGNHQASFKCASGLSPESQGCREFEFTAMTPVPGDSP